MGRKILNRKDLRADHDAAERRSKETEEEKEEDEEEEDDDDDEEAEEGEEAEEEEEADEEAGDDEGDDEEEKPKKKKPKKVKPPPKPKAKSRARTPKVVRMRVVWGVFNNSNQCMATYEYPKKQDAEAHAAKLMAEKRSTFFVQPIKEAIEEKKEK